MDDFKTILVFEWIWWDLEKDTEFLGVITGVWMDSPRLQQRYVQRAYGKRVHAVDDGELEILPSRMEGSIAYSGGIRCKTCGKIF